MKKLAPALILALLTIPATAFAEPAGKFLDDAIKGDNSEMILGRMAQQRGHSQGVRAFGAMLTRDHAKAKRDAVAVAGREHVRVPATMMPEAQAEHRKLQSLQGRAFDREFARYMVEDHSKDVSEFEEQAKSGDRATAALARGTLPSLRAHLRMARNLQS